MRWSPSLVAVAAVVALWSVAAPAALGAPDSSSGPDGGSQGQQQAGGQDGNGQTGNGPNDNPNGPGFHDGQLTPKGTGGPGTINPLQTRNPLCRYMRGKQKRNCRVNQSPETPWSVFNYGLDIHVDDSGLGDDAIVGNFQRMLASIANAIWMGTLLILKLVMTLLGWAFELNPFTNSRSMSSIATGLERFYRGFTEPWLLFALVALGGWAVWRGLARAQVASAIAGTAVAVGLMVLALWIIHEPRQTVGKVSGFVNQATLLVMSAPQGGPRSNPASSYGEATAQAWEAMTTAGFTALNFSDANWALGKPDPELKEVMDDHVCDDVGLGDDKQCRKRLRRMGTPQSNVELFLRSSPGSAARGDDMWNDLDDTDVKEQYLNVQGGDGVWIRLPLALLVCAGLLGGVCLLTWIALRIFAAAAMAFVLVLVTPLALFFPAFGEGGRRAFQFWGTALLGSLLAKLIFGALLAVVLFATGVIYGLVGGKAGVSTMMGFLLASGLQWVVFLKRESLLAFLSVPGAGDDDRGGLLGAYTAMRLGAAAWGATGGRLARGAAGAAGTAAGAAGAASADKAEATKAVAKRQLDKAAAGRLDAHYQAAQGEVEAQRARQARAKSLHEAQGRSAERAAALRRRAAGEPDPSKAARLRAAAEGAARESHGHGAQADRLGALAERREASAQRAREFVSAADRRKRETGSRWSPDELQRSREELRRDLNEPVGSGKHAHYLGMAPREYESLRGREREEAHRRVERRIKDDKRAFGVIPSRPAGAPGPIHRRVAYRTRFRGQGPHATRELAGERWRQMRKRRSGGALRPRGANRRGVSR